MPVFVVCFGARAARRYLAHAETGGTGLRPFIWTPDLGRAEKFGSATEARNFTLDALGHSRWEVVVAPPRGLPTDDLGGSPAAMRAA